MQVMKQTSKGFTLALNPGLRHYQKPNTGVSLTPQMPNGLMSYKILFNKQGCLSALYHMTKWLPSSCFLLTCVNWGLREGGVPILDTYTCKTHLISRALFQQSCY